MTQNLWVYCHGEYIVVYFVVQIARIESGVNRMQVVLSGFSVRLLYFVQAKTLCRYYCMYFLAALVLVCVDVIVMLSS